jgi:hypothetical protein
VHEKLGKGQIQLSFVTIEIPVSAPGCSRNSGGTQEDLMHELNLHKKGTDLNFPSKSLWEKRRSIDDFTLHPRYDL